MWNFCHVPDMEVPCKQPITWTAIGRSFRPSPHGLLMIVMRKCVPHELYIYRPVSQHLHDSPPTANIEDDCNGLRDISTVVPADHCS